MGWTEGVIYISSDFENVRFEEAEIFSSLVDALPAFLVFAVVGKKIQK